MKEIKNARLSIWVYPSLVKELKRKAKKEKKSPNELINEMLRLFLMLNVKVKD